MVEEKYDVTFDNFFTFLAISAAIFLLAAPLRLEQFDIDWMFDNSYSTEILCQILKF